MTKEQRAALDALPPKRRAFVLAYVGECAGNATAAARKAGYAKPHPEGAQLLQNPTVVAAVDVLRKPAEERAYRGVEELRAWWNAKMQAAAKDADQIKASELLAKSVGALVERVEHSGKSAQVLIAIKVEERAEVDALLKGGNGNE